MKNILLLIACSLVLQLQVEAQKRAVKMMIPDQYIITFRTALIQPVDKRNLRNTDRIARNTESDAARQDRINRIRKILAQYGITGADVKNVLVDGGVGAVVKIRDLGNRDKLKQDASVLELTQDFETQMIDPAMQGLDPAMQGIDPTMQGIDPTMQSYSKPIMQLDPIMQSTWYDIDAEKKVQKGILKVGGPVDASSKTSAIWVLDTGIDPTQRQLNVETNTALSKSFIDNEPSFADGNGHGTHVAGLAAARDLGNGVAGVSAGAKVIAVKVLSKDGRGSWSGVVQGLNHVAQFGQPGDVVNMSFGSWDPENTESTMPLLTQSLRALATMGIYVSMSAGNDSLDAAHNLPGLVNGDRIFTVGAIDISNNFQPYSNFNQSSSVDPIDFVVPGHRMLSLWIPIDGTNTFRLLSGTSMASAVMAGIIHASLGSPTGGAKVNAGDKSYLVGEVKK